MTTENTSRFLGFMNAAVSNFLATEQIVAELLSAGFSELHETDRWQLRPGDRRYVVKNSSAVMAFVVGSDAAAGASIIAAHSDSPGFRLKPNPEMVDSKGAMRLNTEVYGGAIYHTWFDRPLGLSGRVLLRTADPLHPRVCTVRLDEPRLIIPHLAIHFNREVNKGVALSAQKDMLPVLGYVDRAVGGAGTVRRLVAEKLGVAPEEILDFDLTIFDVEPAMTAGLDGTWVNSGRLDDLAMAWCALKAIKQARPCDRTQIMAIFDNEETGSGTKQGAHSPLLRNVMRRISLCLGGTEEDAMRSVADSFLVSADCAHAAHPNYMEKMDPVNHPVLGGGPVIKVNANCKYMTDGESASVFKELCRRAEVPYQEFVNHSDSPGGSTLGNILTSQLDIRGVDMGIGLWAMHSVRETASLTDIDMTIRVFTTFYNATV